MSNELTPWMEKLAAKAEADALNEETIEIIPTLSIRNGIIKIGGEPVSGNKVACVISAHTFENAYYDVAYNPDSLVPPVCFAFGDTSDSMMPHSASKEPQNKTCIGCKLNEFGSASTGKGKACGNRRKLMLIPAGEFDRKTNEWLIETDASFYESATPAILSIPPTSLIEFAKYIKKLYKDYKLPVDAVITEIKVIPDDKRQFVVCFNYLDTVSEDMYNAIDSRAVELKEYLTRPYQYRSDNDTQPQQKTSNKF